MSDPIVTADLSRFGYRELRMAGELLTAYASDGGREALPGNNVSLCMNVNSGYVFLSDEDFNVAMMNGDRLEPWFSCPECGHEGFREDMVHGDGDESCEEYCEDIGAWEHGEPGTVISGTHRDEDVIPALETELKRLRPHKARDLEKEHEGWDAEGADIEAPSWYSEALFDALNECAPEGYYFGAHPGDGADFGYWPDGDENLGGDA